MKNYSMLLLVIFNLILTDLCYSRVMAINDLDEALNKAKQENKMIFIEYGREACGNCQHLKSLINSGKVNLPNDNFVYVNLDCDNPKISDKFFKMFSISGNTLPFVVIAGQNGKQLITKTGYGDEGEYKNMIEQAKTLVKEQGTKQDNAKIEDKKTDTMQAQQKAKTIEDIQKSLNYNADRFKSK